MWRKNAFFQPWYSTRTLLHSRIGTSQITLQIKKSLHKYLKVPRNLTKCWHEIVKHLKMPVLAQCSWKQFLQILRKCVCSIHQISHFMKSYTSTNHSRSFATPVHPCYRHSMAGINNEVMWFEPTKQAPCAGQSLATLIQSWYLQMDNVTPINRLIWQFASHFLC